MRGFAIALLFGLAAAPAIACSCGRVREPAEALTIAPIVVEGTVMGRHPRVLFRWHYQAIADEPRPALFLTHRVDIGVRKVYKGNVGPTLHISEIGCCICEYRFEEGTTYLIYVTPHDYVKNGWMASFCLPTKPMEQAHQDLAVLGPPKAVFPPGETTRPFLVSAIDLPHALAAPLVRRFSRQWAIPPFRELELFGWWLFLIGGSGAVVLIAWLRRRIARRRT